MARASTFVQRGGLKSSGDRVIVRRKRGTMTAEQVVAITRNYPEEEPERFLQYLDETNLRKIFDKLSLREQILEAFDRDASLGNLLDNRTSANVKKGIDAIAKVILQYKKIRDPSDRKFAKRINDRLLRNVNAGKVRLKVGRTIKGHKFRGTDFYSIVVKSRTGSKFVQVRSLTTGRVVSRGELEI